MCSLPVRSIKVLVVAAAAGLCSGATAWASAGHPAGIWPPAPTEKVECLPGDGIRIDIFLGALTCDDAYALAAQYDLEGEKYQDVGSFTCYTGNALTRPLIFQCAGPDGEFAVSEP